LSHGLSAIAKLYLLFGDSGVNKDLTFKANVKAKDWLDFMAKGVELAKQLCANIF